MKAFFANKGSLALLIVPLLVIFIFGGVYSRYMTAQVEVHAEEERIRQEEEAERQFALELMTMFPEATEIEKRTVASVEKSYIIPGKAGANPEDFFSPIVKKSYLVSDASTDIGVIYVIESHGNKSGLVLVFAIEFATNSITGIQVLEHNETDTAAYFRKLGTEFYAQFDDLAFDVPVLVVDAVAGATYSSRGFEIATLYAREQYAADFDFVIPVVLVEANDIDYNLDPDTFADYPFVADITYGTEAKNAVVYLALDFSFAAMASGTDDLSDFEKLEIKNLASQAGLSTLSYFSSYDAETRTVVMQAKGYVTRYTIQVTFVINEDLTAIESYSVLSRETYDSEYNELYTGPGVPYVESKMITQYRNGESIDTIAGASAKTEPAILSLIDLFDRFLGSLGGGE